MQEQARMYYPSSVEIDQWVDKIWDDASKADYYAETTNQSGMTPVLGNNHNKGAFAYIRFIRDHNRPFYGYWQPAMATPAPLLVHVPGYGAEISFHPELVWQGYNVLHICPQGYITPDGPQEELKSRDGIWPVLPDTITSGATRGYREWLLDCIIAIQWAIGLSDVLADRISFFGTSQGGGGALLLASLFAKRGVRCAAADEAFLTNFPLANERGAYRMVKPGFANTASEDSAWRALGYIDTISHAHRLDIPVLLTAGTQDETCPAETIESLFHKLPGTKSYTLLEGAAHGYT